MDLVTTQDREKTRADILDLVRKTELLSERPSSEEKCLQTVTSWEHKQYEQHKQDRRAYLQKAAATIQSLEQKLANRKRQSSTSGVPHTSSSTGSAPVSTKDLIEELREPLEDARAILRILNVFGLKKDAPLKEEFLKIFQKTTEAIRKQKAHSNAAELTQQVATIDVELKALRNKLNPRFQDVQNFLKLSSLSEILQVDSGPFGLLERAVDINGTSKYSDRARSASNILGGRHALKRPRH